MRTLAAGLIVCLSLSAARAEELQTITVTEDLTLEAGQTLSARLVIAADHVLIDGQGALLQGPGTPGEPESFAGVAIEARGCRGVTIKNLRARGFQAGLEAQDGAAWTIEGCDFSGNYHD